MPPVRTPARSLVHTGTMPTPRARREPPPFRRVALRRTTSLSPYLRRITLGGEELRDYEPGAPAASVRLLLPRPDDPALLIPTWTGNEFLHSDGSRPTIRTYTPRHFDASSSELDLDVVVHPGGAVPSWLASATAGDEIGIAGPGRGYEIDPDATAFVLVGDESAIPAISQLLEHLPPAAEVAVRIEVTHPDARHDLPPHPGAEVGWRDLPPDGSPGATLVTAVEDIDLPADARVWAAGEAAAMQRIRRHLFEERAIPRQAAVIRGYWKVGRTSEDDSE